MEKLKQNYTSPRWSMEIPDCSMPMSMDTYSRCSYNCLYCFSFFQKSHTTKGYLTGQPRSVNPEKVIALFENAAVNNTAAANKTDVQFFKYIQDRRIMQWGGLADEFDEYERRNGVTLELLRYFDKIDYPAVLLDEGGVVDGGQPLHGAFRPAHAQLARQNQHHYRRPGEGPED